MSDAITRTRIDKFANLSTGHLSESVRNILDLTDTQRDAGIAPDWRNRLSVMSRQYGWFVFIPLLLEKSDHEEYEKIPQCLRDCFELARADGAAWILFDCDEPIIGDLPYFQD